MIAHLSLDAHDPRRVAQVIAELWKGKAMPFPVIDDSWIVLADDENGTAIEVYPLTTELTPGTGEPTGLTPEGFALQPFEVQSRRSSSDRKFGPFHVAMQTALDEAQVKAIAAREGWRAVTCDRGPAFRVDEFWLENRILIELLTESRVGQYRQFMRIAVAGKLLETGPA